MILDLSGSYRLIWRYATVGKGLSELLQERMFVNQMAGAIYYQKMGEVFTAACGSVSHSWTGEGETHAPLLQLELLPVGVSFP